MSNPWNPQQPGRPMPSGQPGYGPAHGAPPGPASFPGQPSQPSSQPGYPPRTPPPAGSTPLGARPPAPVSIDSYAPPPSKVTPAIVLVVAATSLAVGVLGYRFVTSNPAASPTPSASAPAPTATRSGGIPFDAPRDNASGYWSVTSTRWTATQLVVSVSVTLDKGQTKPEFYVFGNTDSTVYDPDDTAPSPEFGTPTMKPGQTASGNIAFTMKRGNATLVLTDSAGRQVSALPIKG